MAKQCLLCPSNTVVLAETGIVWILFCFQRMRS